MRAHHRSACHMANEAGEYEYLFRVYTVTCARLLAAHAASLHIFLYCVLCTCTSLEVACCSLRLRNFFVLFCWQVRHIGRHAQQDSWVLSVGACVTYAAACPKKCETRRHRGGVWCVNVLARNAPAWHMVKGNKTDTQTLRTHRRKQAGVRSAAFGTRQARLHASQIQGMPPVPALKDDFGLRP